MSACLEEVLEEEALYRQCELRRFDSDGRVRRSQRWIPEAHAVVGNRVDDDHAMPLRRDVSGEWEIVSAPDPALPAASVRLFEAAEKLRREVGE